MVQLTEMDKNEMHLVNYQETLLQTMSLILMAISRLAFTRRSIGVVCSGIVISGHGDWPLIRETQGFHLKVKDQERVSGVAYVGGFFRCYILLYVLCHLDRRVVQGAR